MREFPYQELANRDQQLRDLHRKYALQKPSDGWLDAAGVKERFDYLRHRAAKVKRELPFHVYFVGESYEKRPIRLATIGRGEKKVLMWTQMHGDEPTHTVCVLDILNTLINASEDEFDVDQLLDRVTLQILPMLNPDGAARRTRANAQNLDINRDAVELATKEGAVLRSVVNDLSPDFGFNLHNQRADKKVGDTDRVAVLSVLAPPLDEPDTTTPQMLNARQLAVEMFACGERAMSGHSTRYEAAYMPTAFGEWVQNQGTITVLLEAGGWPEGRPNGLEQLHYVTLLTALWSIANQSFAKIDAARYAELPLNG